MFDGCIEEYQPLIEQTDYHLSTSRPTVPHESSDDSDHLNDEITKYSFYLRRSVDSRSYMNIGLYDFSNDLVREITNQLRWFFRDNSVVECTLLLFKLPYDVDPSDYETLKSLIASPHKYLCISLSHDGIIRINGRNLDFYRETIENISLIRQFKNIVDSINQLNRQHLIKYIEMRKYNIPTLLRTRPFILQQLKSTVRKELITEFLRDDIDVRHDDQVII